MGSYYRERPLYQVGNPALAVAEGKLAARDGQTSRPRVLAVERICKAVNAKLAEFEVALANGTTGPYEFIDWVRDFFAIPAVSDEDA